MEDTLESLPDSGAIRERDEARRAASEGDYIAGIDHRAHYAAL
ncbi:hypothetical protein [Ilumatobacter sp.]